MVRSNLEYCASVWSPHTEKLKSKLEQIQNENDLFVRAFLAYFAETCTHSIFSKFTDNVFHFVHCVYPVMSEVHKYISLFSYSKIQWYRETAAKCYRNKKNHLMYTLYKRI
jgi:hypothetical protein